MEEWKDIDVKEKCKELQRYIISLASIFYIIPMFMKDMGSAILIVLMITPALCFILAMIFALYHEDILFYNIILIVLYIPSIFIFYNTIAGIYALGYVGISFMGWYASKSIKTITEAFIEKTS